MFIIIDMDLSLEIWILWKGNEYISYVSNYFDYNFIVKKRVGIRKAF